MKLGLIARFDNSGLANQTKTFYDHLKPYRTLLIDMTGHGRTGKHFPERFPDHWKAIRDDELSQEICEQFVKGLDVLLTAETPYNYGLYDAARQAGCTTVVHANPEFWKHDMEPNLPRPDVVILPTVWRSEYVTHDAILPTPIDRSLIPFKLRTEATNVLHIAGHRASGDRNGTQLAMQAARFMPDHNITVTSQADLPNMPFAAKAKGLRVLTENFDNWWDLYEGQDMLLMPRRYGGQALAVNEALASGMPVVCLDREPENTWGGCVTAQTFKQREFRTQAGRVPLYGGVPRQIAKVVESLDGNVESLSEQADAHAESISWTALKDDWMHALEGRFDLMKYRP